jgi:hypothetical protein
LAFSYSVFGLLIHCNLALPGLPNARATDGPDLEIHAAIRPPFADFPKSTVEELVYVSAITDADGQPALHLWRSGDNDSLRLAYSDGTQFWLDHSRRNLWVTWPTELSLYSTLSYLLGPVLGLLLRLRGITCLHASAVAFDDWSVLFVGASGTGKSTTAAAFAKLGHAVLSDDIAALSTSPSTSPSTSAWPAATADAPPARASMHKDSSFYVLPAYPQVCLWPDSVKMIYGPAASLPILAPDSDKCRLPLGSSETRFETRSLPVGAIYIFDDRRADPAPYVRPARGQTSLLSLVANTYANGLLDRAMRAEEFAVLDRLLASVPVRLLTPHQAPERIAQLCECVRLDFAALRR